MLEKEITIPIPETKLRIYGKLYGELDKPLVIFVHGLTGFMDEQQFYNGVRYFYKKGFSAFRFNLYDESEDARKLANCTLALHAHDLDVVIEYFRQKKLKKIFVIGHSYGGPTILLSEKKQYDGVVLWDPSYETTITEAEYIKELDAYLLHWGYSIVIGKEMYQEAKDLPWDSLTPQIQVPIKIIGAAKSWLAEGCRKYFEQANEPKALVIIDGASHGFSEEGVADKLFQESVDWLKQYVIKK